MNLWSCCLKVALLVALSAPICQSQDAFDDAVEKLMSVNWENCRKTLEQREKDVLLDEGMVYGVPGTPLEKNEHYQDYLSSAHNLAHNRAFFYSFIIQHVNFTIEEPGFLYYYYSSMADLAAYDGLITGSSVVYDKNTFWPNWYPFPKNAHLPSEKIDYFPYVRRPDPLYEYFIATEAGVGDNSGYTDSNRFQWPKPWQSKWFPKSMAPPVNYTIVLEKLFKPKKHILVFGPPESLPVKFTPPYFECGLSNEWIVSAVAPISNYERPDINYNTIPPL